LSHDYFKTKTIVTAQAKLSSGNNETSAETSSSRVESLIIGANSI